MFGVVPRPLWEKKAPPDDRNRIQLAMRPLVVEAEWGRMIDRLRRRRQDGREAARTSTRSTRRATSMTRSPRRACPPMRSTSCWRRTCTSITSAAPPCATGRSLRPRFRERAVSHSGRRVGGRDPPARAQPGELPAGRLRAAEGRGRRGLLRRRPVVRPGVRVVRTGGHTGQHQIVFMESAGKTAVFTADLIPTRPMSRTRGSWGTTCFRWRRSRSRSGSSATPSTRNLIFFEHDPVVAAGYIREKDGSGSWSRCCRREAEARATN